MKKFKVKELIEVCGDMYIYITDFNKTEKDGHEKIYWQGWADDYFKERPFGDHTVMHISSGGTKEKPVDYIHGTENLTFNVLYVMIDGYQFIEAKAV